MPNEEFPPDLNRKLQKAFAEAALDAYPNPERIGCPQDRKVLKAIAAKTIRPSDPVVQHVARCSPCLREVRELRREQSRHSWKLSVAAALLVLAIALFAYKYQLPNTAPKIVPKTQPEVEISAVLDLSAYGGTRGVEDPSTRNAQSVLLQRGRLNLSILLPDGYPEGRYEFKLLSDAEQLVLSGSKTAAIRKDVATITAHVDTTRLSPGRYSFLLRSKETDWRSFPVTIR